MQQQSGFPPPGGKQALFLLRSLAVKRRIDINQFPKFQSPRQHACGCLARHLRPGLSVRSLDVLMFALRICSAGFPPMAPMQGFPPPPMGFPPFGYPPRPNMPPGMGIAPPPAGSGAMTRGIQPPPASTSAPQKPPVSGSISLPPPPAGAPAQPAVPKVEKKTSLYVGKIPEGERESQAGCEKFSPEFVLVAVGS